MFKIDINLSYGFERKYTVTWGKPVFVLSRGKSACVVLSLSSLSDNIVYISLGRVDGLPEEVIVRLEPESYALQPGERVKLKLNITVPLTAPTSKSSPEEFARLWLKSDGWSVGRAFYLEIA